MFGPRCRTGGLNIGRQWTHQPLQWPLFISKASPSPFTPLKESEVWGHLVLLMEDQFAINLLSAVLQLQTLTFRVLKTLNIDCENGKVLSFNFFGWKIAENMHQVAKI